MRAVQADSLESLEGYQLRRIDPPAPPVAGEVLLEVVACGVGYVDALVALGRYQVKPALPHVPGQEVAGRVLAVGGDACGVAPGDRVLASVRGGFAEQAIARAATVSRIPDRMSFAQAAGFPVNYLTALHGLRDRGRLAAGDRLLVLGAAGGVGVAAVQVGRLLGAEVIAAGSTEEKRAFARAQGAHQVIDTEPEGWRGRLQALCDGGGPDVVFDPVCGPLFEPAFRSLSWRGRHLVVGFVGGPIPALRANLSLLKGAAMIGVDVRQFKLLEPAAAAAQLDELLGWVADGVLEPPVGRVFALDRHRECLAFAWSGKGLGKTILAVDGQAG